MTVLDTLVTTAVGALFATVGTVVGSAVTRKIQDRQWLRDKQLAAFVEVLRQYARFAMVVKRARAARSRWDYDWSEWSAALVTASLVAPSTVTAAIDGFGRATDPFLAVAAVDPVEHPLTAEEFEQASLEPAKAQLALVNAIRRPMGKDQGALRVWIGGSLARPETGHEIRDLRQLCLLSRRTWTTGTMLGTDSPQDVPERGRCARS